MRSLSLHTSDGHELGADIAEAEGSANGAAVICHPHPLYGGNRYNNVVDALFAALPQAGFTAIRFDFRRAHDKGVGERLDVVAALEAVHQDGLPSFVVGYSFGALVALATTDPRIAGVVAVAPPLTAQSRPPATPCLVLSGSNDQYCAADSAAPIVAAWPDAVFETVDGADHFLVGHTTFVAERSVAWLASRIGPAD
ncbi:MAG: hypothetical protein ABIR68_18160 [Ilumatobacteraceae bacterium]